MRALVLGLANENNRLELRQIRDAVRGINIEIGRTAVAAILPEAADPALSDRVTAACARRCVWGHIPRRMPGLTESRLHATGHIVSPCTTTKAGSRESSWHLRGGEPKRLSRVVVQTD